MYAVCVWEREREREGHASRTVVSRMADHVEQCPQQQQSGGGGRGEQRYISRLVQPSCGRGVPGRCKLGPEQAASPVTDGRCQRAHHALWVREPSQRANSVHTNTILMDAIGWWLLRCFEAKMYWVRSPMSVLEWDDELLPSQVNFIS